MENAELDIALEELENRLERLRALYEQYFIGIERIEPVIPRKDIDRRIYVLRREKIRNTAKRFKLQTIIARYNTFQQYWQRICREIEQGTYKRHVIKAERIAPGKMLTIAARKRLGRAALEAMQDGDARPPEAQTTPLPAAVESSAMSPANVSAPALVTTPNVSTRAAPPPKPLPPPKPGQRAPLPAAPASSPAAAIPAPIARPAAEPPRAAPSLAAPPPRFESLDLDMDFLGDWDPGSSTGKAAPRRAPAIPARPFGESLSPPLGTPPTPRAAAKEIQARPVGGATPAQPAAAKAAARSSSIPPKPVTAPPRPTRTSAARTSAPMVPDAPARPAQPAPPTSAAQAEPPPPGAKALGAVIPGRAPKPAAPKPSLSGSEADRVRELHARLVEAKRQTQDGAVVSLEGLAKSMKATEAKLLEQHKGRQIDFDVVIKDGRAVLKPIVR